MRALREELCFPSGVLGPRDLAPLAREAACWASEWGELVVIAIQLCTGEMELEGAGARKLQKGLRRSLASGWPARRA